MNCEREREREMVSKGEIERSDVKCDQIWRIFELWTFFVPKIDEKEVGEYSSI